MKKEIKFLTSLFLVLTACSCGNKTDSSTSSFDSSSLPSNSVSNSISSSSESSSDSFSSVEVVENDLYNWVFNEGGSYSGNVSFTASGRDDSKGELTLKINDSVIKEEESIKFDAKIVYDTDSAYPIHSDTVEHCFNEITFNGESLGSLPSDNSNGVSIFNEQLNEGTNIFSITIGESYNTKAWNKDAFRGGFYHVGWGDDFRIANVGLKLDSGEIIKPTKMVLFKPADLKTAKYNTYEVEQPEDTFYWLGDGWGGIDEGNVSIDKSPNPRLDIPFRIEYYFDYETPAALSTYNIDTSKYKDGNYNVSLYDEGDLVLQNNIKFDNTTPSVETNLQDYNFINNGFKLNCSIKDYFSGIKNKEIKIDGTKYDEDQINFATLYPGKHNLIINVSDYADNKIIYIRNFVIMANAETINVSYDNNQVSINPAYDSRMVLKVSEANELSYTSLNPFNVQQVSSTSVPYDEFDIDVTDDSHNLYLSYEGTTIEGERIVVEAFNPITNAYERVAFATSNNKTNIIINPKKYVNNNKVKVRVSPFYFGNGSNRMLWSSDTQYLPKIEFSDINHYYTDLMNYVVNEYKNNKMAYLAHTGDVVDDHPGYGQSAINQWELATKAFKILDDAKVPYGVSAGNHDVGSSVQAINYVNFSKYMGVDRFKDNDAYTGSLNNNECHYDLITVGEYDFIVLYLGFGIEAKKETIQWANEILKKYRHRNAIVATHAYLTEKGEIDKNSQAQQIYDYIVVPNDNVKFVFCGHTDGNALVKKQINDSRYVYEILNCYQFVETGKYNISHIINGYKCNGEAFIKELFFTTNKVTCHTFSPAVKTLNPYGNKYGFADDFEIEVDLYSANREFMSKSLVVYQITDNMLLGDSNAAKVVDLSNLDANKKYIAEAYDRTDAYGFTFIG